MRRYVFALLLVPMLSVPLLAQMTQLKPQPAHRPPRPSSIPVDLKMRYICKQLDLDEKQWQHVEGLLAVVEAQKRSNPESLAEYLRQLQAVVQERDAAREAGDAERARELNEKLANMAPGRKAEKDFIADLLPALTDEQKKKFEELQKSLANVTDLSLKPIQVLRVAREYDLTPDQHKALLKIQEDFRERMEKASDSGEARAKMLQELIDQVSAIFEGERRREFEERIDKMRPGHATAAPRPRQEGGCRRRRLGRAHWNSPELAGGGGCAVRYQFFCRAYHHASRPPSMNVSGSASPRTARPAYLSLPPSTSNFHVP